MSFELVTAPGNGDAVDTTSEHTTRSGAKFRKSSPGDDDVCSPSDWWKLSIKDPIEANEIQFVGPCDKESWEYEEVKKILARKSESKGFNWQPLLCRNELDEYSSDLAFHMENNTKNFVFVAFARSSHSKRACVVMLSIMVVEMQSTTEAFVHLLCSGVPTMGGRLLAFALTKLKSDNQQLEFVRLSPTDKAVNFYEKHGFQKIDYSMAFDFRTGLCPVHVAASKNDEVVLQTLLKAGVNVNQANKKGDTSLNYATYYGYEAIVKALLKAGADVNQTNDKGNISLILAAKYGHEAVVKALLKAGANVNQANEKGNTSLILAAESGYEAIVKALLKAGANVNQANEKGNTSLNYAAKNDHEAIVKALLAAGANANQANKDGNTSLILAAKKGYEAVAKTLLAAGANANQVNNYGGTSLNYAAESGHEAVVKALLAAGAKSFPRDV